jgi:hypothetical protein
MDIDTAIYSFVLSASSAEETGEDKRSKRKRVK